MGATGVMRGLGVSAALALALVGGLAGCGTSETGVPEGAPASSSGAGVSDTEAGTSEDGLGAARDEGLTKEGDSADDAVGAVLRPEADDASSPTLSQRNALSSARSYLDCMNFSHQGLIDQLEFEGYSEADATWAADSCGADWNEQAVGCAKGYLDSIAFSYTGLIGQLEYEGFTTEEATYGADNCEADWNEQAAKSAKNYLREMSFSRSGLIEQLEYEGFTPEQATYGVDAVGL